jgi:CDP-paratose 2-epimerase
MKILITGGAGFIGTNCAESFSSDGHRVVVFDNLSRRGTASNLRWLNENSDIAFINGDVRNHGDLTAALREHPDVEAVLHLAAQTAVTTSVQDPREDFDINALGTFNVLEAIREAGSDPILIYASTNKVYGGMEDVTVDQLETRYAYRDYPGGIPESQNLDFHSPYGCSKGAADQYVRDYARIYGLRTVVFRQSCIYGRRQFGIEDQGWVAWFTLAAVAGLPTTIYGDGKQVRDVLFVDDLVAAYKCAIDRADVAKGRVYNVGGGPELTVSVWSEFGPMLQDLLGAEIPVTYADWRPGDQPVYVSDISRAEAELGWRPSTGVQTGIGTLFNWIKDNLDLFCEVGLISQPSLEAKRG